MKVTIKTAELQIGDFVVGYNKTVANVWKSGEHNHIVVKFTDGSEWLTYKHWETTVLREENT